jgi:protein-S-isoprenylcysteine O-methyltransferase Ste14
MMKRLARLRVPLGFLSAAVAFWLARPTGKSWWIGVMVALVGEGVRIWAAGHIEKGREITSSGPYRFVRHPLYLGSTILGVGFVIAAASLPVAILVALYLGITIFAAIRTEEAVLDERFAGAYTDYREGMAQPVARPFSLARAVRNREHRAVAGLAAGFALLAFKLVS